MKLKTKLWLLVIAMPSPLWAVDCEAPMSNLQSTICQTTNLSEQNSELNALTSDWQNGPNTDRVPFFAGTPPNWNRDLEKKCGAQDDAMSCADKFFKDSISSYNHIFTEFQSMKLDDVNYEGLIGMSARTRDEIYIDRTLISSGFEKFQLLNYAPEFLQPYEMPSVDGNCASCFRQNYSQLTKGFLDDILLISKNYNSTFSGGAHPTFDYSISVFDLELVQEIGFTQLFEDEAWVNVRDDIIDSIMIDLDNLERARQQTDGDDNILYFPNVREQLQALPKENWNEMALFPEVAGNQIIGFRLQADDYEFAPHAYSDYYTDIVIPITNDMYKGIKPVYQASFSIL